MKFTISLGFSRSQSYFLSSHIYPNNPIIKLSTAAIANNGPKRPIICNTNTPSTAPTPPSTPIIGPRKTPPNKRHIKTNIIIGGKLMETYEVFNLVIKKRIEKN